VIALVKGLVHIKGWFWVDHWGGQRVSRKAQSRSRRAWVDNTEHNMGVIACQNHLSIMLE